jgi:hypothetical protein
VGHDRSVRKALPDKALEEGNPPKADSLLLFAKMRPTILI